MLDFHGVSTKNVFVGLNERKSRKLFSDSPNVASLKFECNFFNMQAESANDYERALHINFYAREVLYLRDTHIEIYK